MYQMCGWTGTNGIGSQLVADISYATVTTNLIPAYQAPASGYGAGTALRFYVSRLDIDVQGVTPWTGLTALCLQDTAGVPIVWIPSIALKAGPTGNAAYSFPSADVEVPLLFGATTTPASEGAATILTNATISSVVTTAGSTVFTFSGSVFSGTANSMKGYPFTVVDGTGKAQNFIASASTATTLTTVTPFVTQPTTGGWVQSWYQSITSATTTVLTPLAAPIQAAHSLDNGFNVIYGPGAANAGSSRPISDNNGSTTITVAYAFNTAATGGDLFTITNEPNLNGCVDMGVSDHWSCCTPGAGINMVILGGVGAGGIATQGAPVRVYIEGYWAY
jgi:hypothetical protein